MEPRRERHSNGEPSVNNADGPSASLGFQSRRAQSLGHADRPGRARLANASWPRCGHHQKFKIGALPSQFVQSNNQSKSLIVQTVWIRSRGHVIVFIASVYSFTSSSYAFFSRPRTFSGCNLDLRLPSTSRSLPLA